jgi:hypothetical protein
MVYCKSRRNPYNELGTVLKVCEILLNEAGGSKSYKAHKYSLDAAERPTIDYGNSEVVWKKMAESIPYTKHRNMKSLCDKITKHPQQILAYFLDGSRHVFKVDDQAYSDGSRSLIYPIIAGQAGVGCCKRTDRKISFENFKQEFVISIPDVANADKKPGFFEAVTQNLNESEGLKRIKLSFSAILPYKTSVNGDLKDRDEFTDRGTACVQDRMIKMEKDLVVELVKEGKLNQDNYLVKDGSLEYKPTDKDKKDKKTYKTFKNNYSRVLGISKNFNPGSCIDNTKKPNPGFIADLPLYHRTPVACYENQYLGDIQFAVWYIRIRDQSRTRTPFDGILKVEKILADSDDIIDSEEVDLLSSHLINERMPTCYGSDFRWANHLYPIYLTESFVKSRYLSTESFLNLF